MTYREAYRGLRNEGCWPFVAGFVALVWLLYGVEVETDATTKGGA